MLRLPFLVGGLVSAAVSLVSANPIEYQVSINTSTITGTAGSLDFQFNQGSLISQSASLKVLDFMTDGTLVPPPFPTGDVTGTLPSTLLFDNGTGFNDYFEDFTFGNSLLFDVSLFGAALSSPDGTSTSGSTFAFSMFSDVAGTTPALTTNPAGFALAVDVNLDGTTHVTNFSTETSVETEQPTTIPEPSSLMLMGTALALVCLKVKRQRFRRS